LLIYRDLCLALIVFVTLIFLIAYIPHKIFAISPAFPGQEITDDQKDWINMTNKEPSSKGDRSTDILAADYFSDGNILNATLWLYFPFKDHPTNYNQINYGMFIDADFNKNTGYGGLDYLFEIGWRNNTKTWTQTLWALSPTGEQKTIDIKHNYTGFFEKGKAYVVLPLNLSLVHYPTKYKVTFYAEVKKGNDDSFITDFTRTVAIPPLELAISTSPTSLTLRPGDNKTIELKINSTKGFEPIVFLSTAKNQSGDIKSDIKFNKLRIPSYGVATTPVTIAASEGAASRPYTLFIFANSTFPSEDLIKEFTPAKATITSSPVPESQDKSQNVISQSTMGLTVEDPLTFEEKISEFWNKLGNPITFSYGVAAGISPWIFSKLKEKIKKK
jgi:hypothetical protein